ncbi:uncharacterized protein Tco025E_01638 [Trypanosoma conorhini]|uniref:Uncharacterized protein n=1 Tax=Trypanosoma conorhini TaxID=83891 RepID=A0A3R7NZ40_9TRYP|nr:uncharacterized protein Tco025E_01638 [Trypanosoma conorhini]RNF26109.1 hypothetical protein Tco025E_01638 [Trypanosoma conorhini]
MGCILTAVSFPWQSDAELLHVPLQNGRNRVPSRPNSLMRAVGTGSHPTAGIGPGEREDWLVPRPHDVLPLKSHGIATESLRSPCDFAQNPAKYLQRTVAQCKGSVQHHVVKTILEQTKKHKRKMETQVKRTYSNSSGCGSCLCAPGLLR